MGVVICDIDGCIADSRWRDDRAYHQLSGDKPVETVIKIVNLLASEPCYNTVILVTGRPNACRMATIGWLNSHDVRWDHLLMRPDGDRTPTADLKLKLMKEVSSWTEAILIIEDRSDCVDALKCLGKPVLQVHLP